MRKIFSVLTVAIDWRVKIPSKTILEDFFIKKFSSSRLVIQLLIVAIYNKPQTPKTTTKPINNQTKTNQIQNTSQKIYLLFTECHNFPKMDFFSFL